MTQQNKDSTFWKLTTVIVVSLLGFATGWLVCSDFGPARKHKCYCLCQHCDCGDQPLKGLNIGENLRP